MRAVRRKEPQRLLPTSDRLGRKRVAVASWEKALRRLQQLRRDQQRPAGRLGQFFDPVSGVDGIADNCEFQPLPAVDDSRKHLAVMNADPDANRPASGGLALFVPRRDFGLQRAASALSASPDVAAGTPNTPITSSP